MQAARLLNIVLSYSGLHNAIVALLLLCTAPLYAEEDGHDIEVTEQGGLYHISASIVINAPADYVHQVLSDFVHIYRLNPSIIESEVLPSDEPGSTRVRTLVLGCAGYFCEELERIEKVRELPSGDLVAEIVPEKSEFRSGRTVWHVEALGERSRLVYDSEMEPDFFIPPVVGKFMVKKSIRTGIATSFQNLEKIAKVLAERDWLTDFRLSSLQSAAYTPCELARR
jgi:Polyketide cyclase / dehydrase and lipid transport